MYAKKKLITLVFLFIVGILQMSPSYAGKADDLIEEVKSLIERARAQAQGAHASARETRDAMRQGRMELTDKVRSRIFEAVEDVRSVIDDELEFRDGFIPDGNCGITCTQFRNELHDLVVNMETTYQGIVGITEMDLGQPLEFKNTKKLVNNIPGRGLYPIYRVVAAENNILTTVNDVMGSLGDSISTLDENQCDLILENSEGYDSAIRKINRAAISFKLIGRYLSARGESTLSEGDIGIHGYIHVTAKTNQKKKFGHLLGGVSDTLNSLSSFASGKLTNCTMLKNQEDSELRLQAMENRQEQILRNQEYMIATQETLMEAIVNATPPGRRK